MPAPSASPPSTRERRAALLGLAAVLGTALLLQLAIWDRWIGLLDEGFVLQTAQLGIELGVALGKRAQLPHAIDELDDGLFEGEDVGGHGGAPAKLA